jgi:hypothetical protein
MNYKEKLDYAKYVYCTKFMQNRIIAPGTIFRYTNETRGDVLVVIQVYQGGWGALSGPITVRNQSGSDTVWRPVFGTPGNPDEFLYIVLANKERITILSAFNIVNCWLVDMDFE